MERRGREQGDPQSRGAPRGPVLHIAVVGFHHKKGCQVEFSYPPLILGESHDSHSLPEEWKYLPFLALPDGAHNYQEDTVFFHLPPRCGDRSTIYGVSCYRQIEAKALKVRQADITRETVQKSVCVLSQLPLYGLLQAKLHKNELNRLDLDSPGKLNLIRYQQLSRVDSGKYLDRRPP